MARAQDQAKWRRNSGRRRIEAHLPVDQADRLDDLAAQRGVTKTAMLGELIDAAAPPAEAAPARDTDTDDVFEASTGNAEAEADQAALEPEPERQTGTSKTDVPTHKLEQAKGEAPDGRDAWVIIVEGQRVGMAYRNPNPNEANVPHVAWVAVANRAATRKPYKKRTRTQAVEMMLRVERPHERGR